MNRQMRHVALAAFLGLLLLPVGAGAERRLDQRREGLDVGAHDDDIAGFESRIVEQQVEDGVAQDLDLAGPAVTGVDLHAAVLRGERSGVRRNIGGEVGLQPAEQRAGPGGQLEVLVHDIGVRSGQEELQFPAVPPERGEQGMPGKLRGPVEATADVGALLGLRRDGVPQSG